MTTPTIEWAALTPILIVLGTAVFGVLVEAFVPRRARRPVQATLSLAALAGALAAVVWRWTAVLDDGPKSAVKLTGERPAGVGTLQEDLPGLAFQAFILACSLLAFLVFADRTRTGEGSFAASAATEPGSLDEREATEAGYEQTEIFPLGLFAVGGMLAFTSAGDLLTLFIALEVLSLPLYVLCATARRRRALSQEAALKYFILGAFSSAFFLMGAALLYGFSGSLDYWSIASALLQSTGMDALFVAGSALVFVGLLFKVGAAPFHSWTPDAYQGAPTPVTGFMAAGTKIAAFGAMIRFAYSIGRGAETELRPVFWAIVILTMLVGTVGGIVQSDVKRMLAYSSIAHAGFVLVGVGAYSRDGIRSVAFYLLAYGLASVGAFAVVTLVRQKSANGSILGEATSLRAWRGLGKTNPFLAGAMALFLLSFAGIPLTGGFMGKFFVFKAGYASGEAVLVFLAVLASAATAFFYFRLILLMFFRDPAPGTATIASEGLSAAAIAAAAAGIVLTGVAPNAVWSFLDNAMAFIL